MSQFKDRCLKILKDLFKKSSLSSHYFRSNFKMIEIVCKSNKELFT